MASTSTADWRVERTAKRFRAVLDGVVVLDTERARLVWEDRPWPQLWVPRDAVADGAREGAVGCEDERLAGYVRLASTAVDAWFEEDEPMLGHVRDPYHRIDALSTGRHVVVELDGTVLAESHAPVVVHETSLIPRWYLPPTDVRWSLLQPSDTVTVCPYKGSTVYRHLEVGDQRIEDVAWSYPQPLRESAPIAGRWCFDDAKVDVIVDGRRRPRPTSPLLRDLPELD
ncbi:MAG: DUF427 domain-containing protein [Nitriliruptoraceae bacterium]|nr:DUF427 domain-containing protein [Nitriliruptoraceae bacterium]